MANPMDKLQQLKARFAQKKPALDEKEPTGVKDSPAEEQGEPKKKQFPIKKQMPFKGGR